MLNIFSIDLSMRSTGITYCVNKELKDFLIINNSTLKDEDLFISNISEIFEFIKTKSYNPKETLIAIEGLSFNSLSADKDKLAGQFWYLKCKLKELLPNVKVEIISVKEWRSPLFTKDENKHLREAKKKFKSEKKKIKGLKGSERKEAIAFNKELEEACDIKIATFKKLNPSIKELFLDYINRCNKESKSLFDLTDSYFINLYCQRIY